ncbi:MULTISPECIES: glycine cleavage system protein GcvH [Bacteroidota]|jgi:glycine cleavage system H protein|uniref:Glycine cleavage system H protein n=3 Tax=Flectobacillus TaxID=101 RepID=A0ABT6Z459_9BACT|nr:MULTISPECIES: glycine cleavage system protein GcvH [Bacteroidota]NBA76382.1 glycine cleavage system protein GcvH [Emticicia sp. ODNR4P]MDI9858922.1 glycine cleavage system protein GcvH [Flectobacillus roseus]MDI9865689.1 glycine cleavage system protein GcvH [Flectobacillus longus]MDI9875707.1 glycine cleavage system protein GcvH [Flectobacillus rivi]MDI9880861.1 glycine cleavage system protein GcvH [Flectobacillus longus]
MNFPAELRYTKEHEWIKVDGDVAIVGITDFAQGELGDIVYVEIETVGQTLAENDIFGTVEAVKTVSDLFLPIAGEILEVNQTVIDSPETINSDAYGEGWLVKIKPSNLADVEALMDVDTYKQHIGL